MAEKALLIDENQRSKMDEVLHSDIGLSVLLGRLKQSIFSIRDLSAFLKKRSQIEDEHAHGLKKLSRSLHESSQRSDSRRDSSAWSINEIHHIYDRMADHGLRFALSLHHMSEELNDMTTRLERERKSWKTNGLNAEKRVTDAEILAEKAKAKYEATAEQYDRVRTGDKQAGKFGFKGPKSAAQAEEDLLRKCQHSDSEYLTKVQAAQTAKQELVSSLRPAAVRALTDLITECDSALSLQMARLASCCEQLALGNGLCISPLPDKSQQFKSMREVAALVDNEKDFNTHILAQASKVPAASPDIKYERHPALAPTPAPPREPPQKTLSLPPPPAPEKSQLAAPIPTQAQTPHSPALIQSPIPEKTPLASSSIPQAPPAFPNPHLKTQPFIPYNPTSYTLSSTFKPGAEKGSEILADLPPLKPVFGVSLDELYRRDGTAIPLIVYQCIQAVDMYGLNVEGIYRLSGNVNHISQLKARFDNDSTQVDFTNPESFFHDVNSVAGLLKQFFRELPDPLFTEKQYSGFINAARFEDDIQRRDALHALINDLPDPNYATLRALILHLNRVQERSSINRMNAGNIAISFGLTLMGSSAGHYIADSGWQARVIETVLQNTFQIFDED